MRNVIVSSFILAVTISGSSHSSEETAAAFFQKDKAYWSKGVPAPSVMIWEPMGYGAALTPPTSVQAKVAKHTESELGRQWVDTALRLAKLESGYRCNATGPKTRHGNAKGVFQVMPGSARALGYSPSRLHECDYGIAAGVAHMKSCLKAGVRTHDQMARCHVAGVGGWNTRLNRRAERYKRQYVRMASR
jgi:hypothetical protein